MIRSRDPVLEIVPDNFPLASLPTLLLLLLPETEEEDDFLSDNDPLLLAVIP